MPAETRPMTANNHEPAGHAAREALARLYRSAAALCGPGEQAEELAQQAVVAILTTAPDKLDHAGYGRKVVTHTWLTRQRSLARRARRLAALAAIEAARLNPHHLSDHPTATEPSPDRSRDVRRALDALPPKQRAALVLRVVEGLTYQQIAAAINSSPDAARANVHHARTKVRNTLRNAPAQEVPDEL